MKIYETNKKVTTCQDEIIEYLKEYDRFLYKVALSVKVKCRRLELEDIKQQLILVILTNYQMFDGTKNVKKSSYFSQIALNAANNMIKKYWQDKNRINITCVSLDAFVDEQNFQYISMFKEEEDSLLYPENMFYVNEIHRKIEESKEYLSSFERKVFSMHLKGKEVNEIAIKLKKSKKTIYNALAAIKEKVKNNM